jgi:hypothetical protein
MSPPLGRQVVQPNLFCLLTTCHSTRGNRGAQLNFELLNHKICGVLLLIHQCLFLRNGLIAMFVALSATTAAGSDYVGRVTLHGMPVPGATVTATQGEQHVVALSNLDGMYRLKGLSDGSWSLRVVMLGFVPATREITVPSDAPTIWEITIAPVLATTDREGTTTLVEQGLAKALPTRSAPPQPKPQTGRQFQRVEVNAASAAHTIADDPDPFGFDQDAQKHMGAVDGLLLNGSVNNGAESRLAQPSAFGNNRSGRPAPIYGSAGFLAGNSAWDARPFSFTAGQTEKPSYTDWQFFGTLGGQLRIPTLSRNRTTFFVGAQLTHDDNASTYSAIMPSAFERRGDFSQSRDRFGRLAAILDPATGAPFPGNVIPPDRISPQAAALLQYYPPPNVVDNHFNFQATVPVVSRQTNIQSRIAHFLNLRNQLAGALNYQNGTTNSRSVFEFTDSRQIAGLDAAINWTHGFTPFFALRVGYQFTRLSTSVMPYFARRVNVSGNVGVTGNNQEPENWGPPALVFSSGLAGLSDPQYARNQDRTNAWTAESVWHRGAHHVTFGGAIRRFEFDVRSQLDARGTFSFTGAATGLDLADFLLGIPQSSSIAYGNAEKTLRGPGYETYVNDDWRLGPGFSVNAGVRWEYEAPLTEQHGRLVNLDVVPGFTAVAPVTARNRTGILTGRRFPESLLHADVREIQPRLGFAWRPLAGSSLVVRGGYGTYRNTNVYRPIAMLMAQQPPFSLTGNVESSAVNPLTLTNGFVAAQNPTLPTFAVDPHFRGGYAQIWLFSVQKDLPASLTFTATYTGTKGSHLMQEILPNTYPAGTAQPCLRCPVGFAYLLSDGRSLRHAVDGQLRRRLRNGLAASVRYALSTATDDAGAVTGVGLSGGAIAQDWLNVEADEAPSSFDQRHLITGQFEYTTGVGVGGGGLLTGWKGKLVNGWMFTSQFTAGSGLPLTPVYLTSAAGTGITGTIRASLIARPGKPPEGFYFDPTAFAAPASGEWGTAGRNSLRGPAQFNFDSGIARTFRFGKRLNMDWRIDGLNILNRVTYAGVNVLVGSPQFGLPNRANPMRKIRSTLRLRF